jgi:AcrR family transcriptional regulator
MQKRAENVAETRRRIVEAALELHEKVGPARASLSSIAERAGVDRRTYYRNFNDQRSLFSACSGLFLERNPLPDPTPWRRIEDREERLRHGLGEIYAYYEANEAMLSSVIRDAEVDALTREMVSEHIDPGIARLGTALARGWGRGRRARAAIDLALSFHTWRSLVRGSGLSTGQAAELMVGTMRCLG